MSDEEVHWPSPLKLEVLRNGPLEILAAQVSVIHDQLVRLQIPDIKERFAIVVKLHNHSYPDIGNLRKSFFQIASLLEHIAWLDSRGILTYAIDVADKKVPVTRNPYNGISYGEKLLMRCTELHDVLADHLASLIESGFDVSNFKTIDADYNHLLQALNNFEDDLKSLAHLKLDILFQRVLEAERPLNTKYYPSDNTGFESADQKFRVSFKLSRSRKMK